MTDTEPLWTVDQVAAFLSMSRQWVYKHAELGNLPCRRMGASLRFKPSEIRKYVDDCARRPMGRVVSIHRGER